LKNQKKRFSADPEIVKIVKGQTILIKVGGNALTDAKIKKNIISQISTLQKFGVKVILVHGGGIEIKRLLDEVSVKSEFIGGHRKTDAHSISYIEMALSGMVNKELVALLHRAGLKAVGISGKDGALVIAEKRMHKAEVDGVEQEIDLGFVGDVASVNTDLVNTLLNAGYTPVISPISIGEDSETYNINADMFAGHLAGALKADRFIALTNIDGLLQDIDDPKSIIHHLSAVEAKKLFGTVIQGGMIPKIEACLIALEKGVKTSQIVNGTKQDELLRILLTKDKLGTTIG
jgi:acetylglutamate kinase